VIALRKEAARLACGIVMTTDAVTDPVPAVFRAQTWALVLSATTNLGIASGVNANPSRFGSTPRPVICRGVSVQFVHDGGIRKNSPLTLTA
jgi:hypothetical protein